MNVLRPSDASRVDASAKNAVNRGLNTQNLLNEVGPPSGAGAASSDREQTARIAPQAESRDASEVAPVAEHRAKLALTPRTLAEMSAKAQAFGPGTARRLNRCMMIQYDAEQHKWKDALRRTPSKGLRHVDMKGGVAKGGARLHGRIALPPGVAMASPSSDAPLLSHPNHAAQLPPMTLAENPLFIGLMLMLAPPVGVTLAWTSTRLGNSGKIALTAFGGLVMLLASGMAILVAIR